MLESTGNTQAYALGSMDALLELDLGWEWADSEVIEKVGDLHVFLATMASGRASEQQQHDLCGYHYVY